MLSDPESGSSYSARLQYSGELGRLESAGTVEVQTVEAPAGVGQQVHQEQFGVIRRVAQSGVDVIHFPKGRAPWRSLGPAKVVRDDPRRYPDAVPGRPLRDATPGPQERLRCREPEANPRDGRRDSHRLAVLVPAARASVDAAQPGPSRCPGSHDWGELSQGRDSTPRRALLSSTRRSRTSGPTRRLRSPFGTSRSAGSPITRCSCSAPGAVRRFVLGFPRASSTSSARLQPIALMSSCARAERS